ncbi:MAG: hypothetical protein CEN88_13 [Candidatus Berkelbacteria bacterium Licking1014_2]|uniref:Hydrogenase expression/formation protein HypC n=1 Tax=Candidatus Berkelbacteria bacterium Licking1014_2 TaxID=2017146 RepID=A0A554LXA9_9BACT|nr:MAG: hypothetical protein CEN88_13 [Candidatus Berkelbacteria bacterium Licking1014_2]
MCLATPIKIKQIKDKQALVDKNRWVDISLIQPPPKIGDYLLSTHNIAINRLDAAAAKEILSLADQCQHQTSRG